jgi:tetratricopeptide (TPR) repeat protein
MTAIDSNPVHAWEETVVIPTYPAPPPDMNPMFFEKRVNQGASGRVYPNPFTDRANNEIKVDQPYQAVFLENDYIQLMVLPQFGGRIHAALDKTNGYDFIYRQHVIKPALIGLFGSWLSGGMEFNWPQHHRPSTFMPVEYVIEKSSDGSATLWLSEHEPMNRMKGMLGICIYPGKSYFELKVQLYNRTPFPQPFLWWVNCAVHINDHYQLVFPPDVESVTYHSRAFMTTYPVARDLYAGLDWRAGVDISWLKNVSYSTSYFANPSKYEFFGGYDHGKQAGIIHVADHHISPGKKLFTWGTGEFGTSWQSTLTDNDGPYAELMASAYSDNQPDFSWLQPYETKLFRQCWYPVQQIGVVKNANSRLAVNLESDKVGVCSTEELPGVRIVVTVGDTVILDKTTDLLPGKAFLSEINLHSKIGQVNSAILKVIDVEGKEVIRYQPESPRNAPLPDVAVPPKLPEKIDSLEELYLTGLHVEQYLDSTLDPAPYWERALKIDPADSRSNNALGRLLLRRGDFIHADVHFRQVIQTLTRYNFNPYDGEPYYNLGLTLAYQGCHEEAYDAFYKCIWSYAWQAAGYYALAQIDCRGGNFASAISLLDRSLAANACNTKARNLKAAALRHLGQLEEALKVAHETIDYDPLDHWAHNELVLSLQASGKPVEESAGELERILRGTDQNYLDLAFDYANAGLYEEACGVLKHIANDPTTEASMTKEVTRYSAYPMVYYALGFLASQMGNASEGSERYRQAALLPPDLCFPARLEELIVLQAARLANPKDGRAAYYLGNLLYDKKQYEQAIEAWQAATRLDPGFAIPWRNLGVAIYNKRGDKQAARDCYQKAFAANTRDPRLLLETDQLMQRLGVPQTDRLSLLQKYPDLAGQRDDLLVEFATLYNQTGQPEKALELLLGHQFHPWEGGEGRNSGQYVLAHVLIGRAALEKGHIQEALDHFEAALDYPKNLGEGRGMGSMDPLAYFYAGQAFKALGKEAAARDKFSQVIKADKDLLQWLPFSQLNYYAALSMKRLGDEAAGIKKLQDLLDFASEQLSSEDTTGFHTSRPTIAVFDDDSKVQNKINCNYLIGLALKGLGHQNEARKAFETVLALDRQHWEASMALQEMT